VVRGGLEEANSSVSACEASFPRVIRGVGIASICSIDSIGAVGDLRALFGGMAAAMVVVIMYRSGKKGGTS
jgi:hypothetical protein